MFHETVTHAGGTSKGTASEAHALMLLRRAHRRGYAIEATREGGARITWTRAVYPVGHVHRSIILTPEMPVGTLTDAVVRDLGLIASARPARYVESDAGRRMILAGLTEISPMATALLRARRLITADDHDTVRLTLSARLGLVARAHGTRTSEPMGWARPSDIGMHSLTAGLNRPGRRAGVLRSSASVATCTCGALSAHGGDRDEARRLALAHRHEMTAAFVASLSTTTTTAITA
ncbi:hypothetical protein OG216_19525 [Streptomycetaceae bacterium NBC_01309]